MSQNKCMICGDTDECYVEPLSGFVYCLEHVEVNVSQQHEWVEVFRARGEKPLGVEATSQIRRLKEWGQWDQAESVLSILRMGDNGPTFTIDSKSDWTKLLEVKDREADRNTPKVTYTPIAKKMTLVPEHPKPHTELHKLPGSMTSVSSVWKPSATDKRWFVKVELRFQLNPDQHLLVTTERAYAKSGDEARDAVRSFNDKVRRALEAK